MSNRIDLDTNLSLDFDGRCITLIHKTVITGEGRGSHLIKKENIGKVREVDLGYYGRIDHALMAYVSYAAASANPDTKAILTKLDEIGKMLEKFNVKCQQMEAPILVEGE